MTARGHGKPMGFLKPSFVRDSEELKRSLADVLPSLPEQLRENLNISIEDEKFGKLYGFLCGGTYYAGCDKGFMLASLLHQIKKTSDKPFSLPEVIIMGDDQEDYLIGFLEDHEFIREVLGYKVYVCHMPEGTHADPCRKERSVNGTASEVLVDLISELKKSP